MHNNLTTLILLTAIDVLVPAAVHAQAIPVSETSTSTATASANSLGPAGIVPADRGYNFSLVSASQYDSAADWSSILTPDLAYRFSRNFSADFAFPTYAYFVADINTGTTAKPVYTSQPRHFVPGDSALSAHVDLPGDTLSYSLTTSLGLPTGDSSYGLSSGQATYNINNHLDVSVGPFSPDIELGIGDASVLVNRRITRGRAFSTTGKLVHFQAGTSVDLPRRISFEADMYEEMPVGTQQVTTTTTTSGKSGSGKGAGKGKGRPVTTTTTNASAAEDNGLTTSLDLPLSPHLVLSGNYGYSIRQRDTTTGLSLTFLLRARPPAIH